METDSNVITSDMPVIHDAGSGRAFVFVFDDAVYEPSARALAQVVEGKHRSIVLMSGRIDADSWQERCASFERTLATLGVRQAAVVCFGAGAALGENLALENPKLVRGLILVDSAARPHPGRAERIADRVERVLPMGLPLRLGSKGFNVRSYLHRLRSPLLVVTTHRAGSFLKAEADAVAASSPTSWRVSLEEQGEAEIRALAEAIVAFQDVPTKCPQKNL